MWLATDDGSCDGGPPRPGRAEVAKMPEAFLDSSECLRVFEGDASVR